MSTIIINGNRPFGVGTPTCEAMILAFYQCLCQAERATETTCMYKSFSVLNARLEN